MNILNFIPAINLKPASTIISVFFCSSKQFVSINNFNNAIENRKNWTSQEIKMSILILKISSLKIKVEILTDFDRWRGGKQKQYAR